MNVRFTVGTAANGDVVVRIQNGSATMNIEYPQTEVGVRDFVDLVDSIEDIFDAAVPEIEAATAQLSAAADA